MDRPHAIRQRNRTIALAPGRQAPALWLFDDAEILGGGQLLVLRLARFAPATGLAPVRIVCPAGTELAGRCAEAGAQHVEIPRLPPLGPLSAPRWPRAIAGIRRVLGEMGDGAVAVGASARAQAYLSAAAPLLRRRPPLVQLMVEQQTLQRRIGRFGYRRVGSLVALGENVAESARALLPGVRVWKANNILDSDEIRPRERGPRPGGAELGVATRLIPEKGILELLDELAGLEHWSRLRIAGTGPDPVFLAEVGARIERYGLGERVIVEGFVEDIPGFLDSVDALLVPSTGREGQPNVVIESLAAGVACIVRRPVYSSDFDSLPVLAYDGGAELGQRLAELPLEPAPAEELRRRFGPEQAYEAILAAAEAAQ